MRDELARQVGRRRTRVLLATMVAIPAALALIYALRGSPELVAGATPQLVHLADRSALSFTVFVLYLCAPLLLVAVAAAFAGDALASEAQWGTLRYLLAAPVRRPRLLARKAGASMLLATAATLLLVGSSLALGAALFGWGPLDTPVGGELPPDAASMRLLVATAFVLVTLAPFVALATWLSTVLDSPLGAVGAATGIAVVSQILDVVPTLGTARTLLPTHYQLAWLDLFVDPPLPDDLAAGVLQATVVVVAAGAAAWWRFARRDVIS